MFKTEILLGVVALSIGVVHSLCSYRDESPADSWDIVISSEGQLEFYSNQTKTNSEGTGFRDLSALAYDAVHNVLFFVDRANDNATIFSFNLATKKFQSLVKNKWLQNIQGLAFDPVKRMLFWTDIIESSIFWMSLMPDSENDGYGNVLIKMNDEIPVSIAVDSCREYIYWTCILITDSKSSIERSKFDGSEREVIVHTHLHMPLQLGLAIDQRTKRLYWADEKEGIHFSIESSNLEGEDRQILLNDAHHRPNTLTISKDWIYWVHSGYKTVWKLAKDKENVEPLEVLKLTKSIFGVVANYGIPECETLPRTLRNKAARFANSKNAWLALVLYFCIFTVSSHFY
ncbi:protein cueball-like [Ostrinia furnacalis]|uniref:protein cueball-like n=1 Tax=Ostrinia furnacalis TaxID=93504 RepID=UPI00103A5F9D|nr:protein cueball-like [Ostrinia furnacalis]